MHTTDPDMDGWDDNGVLDGFAGPGGWDEGARIIGLNDGIVGIEFDQHAVTTAVAAGHTRKHQDIREVDPADYAAVTGVILSSPCPTFSRGGLGTGRADLQLLLDVISCAGSGCDCTWEDRYEALAAAADPRTALAAEVMRFALQLPKLRWLALEQVAVPAVEQMFEEIAAEFLSFDDGGEDTVDEDGNYNPDATGGGGHGPGWECVEILKLDAVKFGMPIRRERMFLVARRYDSMRGPCPAYLRDDTFPPAPTMAQVLGWDPGHRMRTRGNLRGDGGNFFSCDGPSWCLTESARSWERETDRARMTAAQAGLLQGFRADYPWSGARTRQFHQVADVVLPPVAAAVLGYVTNTPWVEPVRRYLAELYAAARSCPAAPAPEPVGQLSLFAIA